MQYTKTLDLTNEPKLLEKNRRNRNGSTSACGFVKAANPQNMPESIRNPARPRAASNANALNATKKTNSISDESSAVYAM
jgi:hypothetical protein